MGAWSAVIHYHGAGITPESVMVKVLVGRHGFVSFAAPWPVETCASICQSFALDNGAFSAWRSGDPISDWEPYYEWVDLWMGHPACDWAVIPDVVDGTEAENDALVDEWPLNPAHGVPVWHLNESPERLINLARHFPRVALGSTSEYDASAPEACVGRLREVLPAIARPDGAMVTKLHGLRMLNPDIFTKVPLSSADSTNIARNTSLDSRWRGSYQPKTQAARGLVLADRIEYHQSPGRIVPPVDLGIHPLFDIGESS